MRWLATDFDWNGERGFVWHFSGSQSRGEAGQPVVMESTRPVKTHVL